MNLICLCALLWGGDLNVKGFQAEMDRLLDTHGYGGFWGVVVYAPLRERSIYQRNAERNFRPPAHMNLLAALLAFEHLGPRYRFQTRYGHTGSFQNGVVKGDLIIRGGGDPSMAHDWEISLTTVIKQLRAKGVRSIAGDVKALTDFFDDTPPPASWEWDRMAHVETVPVSPLYLNHGKMTLTLSDHPNGSLQVQSHPPGDRHLKVKLQVTRRPGETQINVNRAWGRDGFTITGNLPPGAKHRLQETTWRPALMFAEVFRTLLIREGIAVEGTSGEIKEADKVQWLTDHHSQPLPILVKTMFHQGRIHYGNALLNTTAKETDNLGNFQAAAGLAALFLEDLNPGATPGFNVVDGSGLSIQNYLKPRTAAAMLIHAWNQPYRSQWLACFPTMGGEGVLAERGRESVAQGRVKAAYGAQFRSSDLSGYGETQAGEPLIFSIMINNHGAEKAEIARIQDRICALMTRLKPSRKAAKTLADKEKSAQ